MKIGILRRPVALGLFSAASTEKFVKSLFAEDSGACTNQNYIVDGGWV